MSKALVAAVILASSDAFAAGFEFRGFKQDMTIEAATQAASQNQYELRRMRPDSVNYLDVYSGAENVGTVGFCNGKLATAFYTVSSDFQRFLRLLRDLESRGNNQTASIHRLWVGYDGEERGDWSIDFHAPGQSYSTTAALYSSEKFGVTNYQVTYEALDYVKRDRKCD